MSQKLAEGMQGGVILCTCGCGQMRPKLGWDHKPKKFISGHNACLNNESAGHKFSSEETSGEKHWNWRGGKYITDQGYVRVLIEPKKYRYEHRLVMEKKLGRKLKSTEIVHHVNEDRTDNREGNLELTTRSKHNNIHGLPHRGER